MKRLYRLATRKRNTRRLLAAMFLFVFFIEMGSHVLIDSQDSNAVTEAISCSLDDNVPARADCPEQRRQQQETKNLLDEMTTHVVVLNSLTVPHSGILYRTPTNFHTDATFTTRSLTPPFHPPEQG
ncbi:MAG: hypothetical protein JO314_10585 [Acidobacteria bacterium]|nr:hypothetical protein [Acidobacteriota bacterium]